MQLEAVGGMMFFVPTFSAQVEVYISKNSQQSQNAVEYQAVGFFCCLQTAEGLVKGFALGPFHA